MCFQGESQQYKTLTRVRKYEVNGKVVTETTSRIVDVSSEDFRAAVRREQLLRYSNLKMQLCYLYALTNWLTELFIYPCKLAASWNHFACQLKRVIQRPDCFTAVQKDAGWTGMKLETNFQDVDICCCHSI